MEGKSISESRTVMSHVILPSMTNPIGTAHGGELLKIMDNTASVCALRHCRAMVVTAGVDDVKFHDTVFMGNFITCSAHVTYTGKTSAEVAVSIDSEDLLSGKKRCCVTAYFVFVSLDKEYKPIPVPPVKYETESEKNMAFEAEKRMAKRKESENVCWADFY